jgi:hypothetical protein
VVKSSLECFPGACYKHGVSGNMEALGFFENYLTTIEWLDKRYSVV